jgi:hypothetical protein
MAAVATHNRYSEDALDLCDVLSSFSSNARATLDEISRVMGCLGNLMVSMEARLKATSLRSHQGNRRLLRDGRSQHVPRLASM